MGRPALRSAYVGVAARCVYQRSIRCIKSSGSAIRHPSCFRGFDASTGRRYSLCPAHECGHPSRVLCGRCTPAGNILPPFRAGVRRCLFEGVCGRHGGWWVVAAPADDAGCGGGVGQLLDRGPAYREGPVPGRSQLPHAAASGAQPRRVRGRRCVGQARRVGHRARRRCPTGRRSAGGVQRGDGGPADDAGGGGGIAQLFDRGPP